MRSVEVFGLASFAALVAIGLWSSSATNEIYKRTGREAEITHNLLRAGTFGIAWAIGWAAMKLFEVGTK